MTRMDQGWAAVIAATAAGVFGFSGVFAGLIVGRRQTTDQAAVEHGQWLRGQRQTAYLETIDALDAALTKIEDLRDDWDTLYERVVTTSGEDTFEEYVARVGLEARERGARPLERAVLLGPREVDDALHVFETRWMDLESYLRSQANGASHDQAWQGWESARMGALEAREAFFSIAQGVLWEAPRPGRGGRGVSWRGRRR
ncbi:hypothetical protein ACIP2X_38035 [Streptomyces sp. NPDC089424]|uniref:hypothetical protein n=1 Tax=Streptomyces sp. NPDC089424 TaxID=3365917 RepID=UPI00380E3C89